jgi:hypothetical protein
LGVEGQHGLLPAARRNLRVDAVVESNSIREMALRRIATRTTFFRVGIIQKLRPNWPTSEGGLWADLVLCCEVIDPKVVVVVSPN